MLAALLRKFGSSVGTQGHNSLLYQAFHLPGVQDVFTSKYRSASARSVLGHVLTKAPSSSSATPRAYRELCIHPSLSPSEMPSPWLLIPVPLTHTHTHTLHQDSFVSKPAACTLATHTWPTGPVIVSLLICTKQSATTVEVAELCVFTIPSVSNNNSSKIIISHL